MNGGRDPQRDTRMVASKCLFHGSRTGQNEPGRPEGQPGRRLPLRWVRLQSNRPDVGNEDKRAWMPTTELFVVAPARRMFEGAVARERLVPGRCPACGSASDAKAATAMIAIESRRLIPIRADVRVDSPVECCCVFIECSFVLMTFCLAGTVITASSLLSHLVPVGRTDHRR